MTTRLRVGVDLGKVVDSAAIAVCEVTQAPPAQTRVTGAEPSMTAAMARADPLRPLAILHPGRATPARLALIDPLDHLPGPRIPATEAQFTTRHLERIPLGTSYVDVALRVKAVLIRLRARAPLVIPELYVDATGVGIPVIDILRRELVAVPHRLVPVTIAAGDGYHDVVTQDGADRRGRVVPRSARGLRVGKGFLVSRLQALLQTRMVTLLNTDEGRALRSELADFQERARAEHDEYGAKSGSHDDLVIALALAVLDRPRQDARAVADLNTTLGGPTIVGDGPGGAWSLGTT